MLKIQLEIDFEEEEKLEDVDRCLDCGKELLDKEDVLCNECLKKDDHFYEDIKLKD